MRSLGPCLALVLALCPLACSTATSPDGGAPDGATPLAEPPAPGPATPTNGSGNVTIAIDKLFIGDTDPDGSPDMASGWTHFGYNIDGVQPGNVSHFCQPVGGASPTSVHTEGVDGIENSWGHLILPIMLGIDATTSTEINAQLSSGHWTELISLEQLGSGAAYNPIIAQLYLGANLGSAPKFDGTDTWPVSSSSLVNPTDLSQGALASSNNSYLVGNTWVSGPGRSLTLSIPVSPTNGVALTINHAVVSMTLDATHSVVTSGVISGVLVTQQLKEALETQSAQIDPSICGTLTLQSIDEQLAAASDIMQDGTQDPTQTCDAISIGLGFTGHVDQLGGITPALAPPVDPCGDGGTLDAGL